jgi:hypothetical protein
VIHDLTMGHLDPEWIEKKQAATPATSGPISGRGLEANRLHYGTAVRTRARIA